MSMYVDLVLIDYLMRSFWCRDDWSSLITPCERRDDFASSKTTMREDKASTEKKPFTSHGISSSNFGLCSYHIVKPYKREEYLSYKIRYHPSVIPLEASVIS